jgi:hypothetical protein
VPIRYFIAAAAVLLLSPLSLSAGEKTGKDRALELLMSYDTEPGKADWDQVGSDAGDILIEIASDAGRPKIVRARAILALSWFPGKKTREFLLGVVFTQDQDEMLVRKGLYALAGAFGESVVGDVGVFLDHENPDIREASARALGKIASKKALKLLRKRLKVEESEMVRAVLKKEITNLKEKLKKKNDASQ